MYLQALSISFITHIAILLLLSTFPSDETDLKPREKLTELEFINVSSKQIVAEALSPNLDLANQVNTKYQSKTYQRVEEQQMATESGLTSNRSRFDSKKIKDLPPVGAKSTGTASLSDLKSSNETAQSKKEKVFDQVKQEDIYESLFEKLGTSTIENRIFENVKQGHFTSLNTDANRFYSFHQRVSQQIRIRWEDNIKRHLDELIIKKPGYRFADREWISQIEVILSKEGNLINSYIARSSGADEWDQAALQAFRQATPFINPPEAMADQEGLVRLSYMFSLTP